MNRITRMFCALLPSAALVLSAVAPATAASGRFRGEVVDEAGTPLAGVSVTVTSADLPTFTEQLETNKRGVFTLQVARVEPTYTLQLTKPGYRSLKADIQIKATEMQRETYTLSVVAGEEAAATEPTPAASTAVNAAIESFNAGLRAQRAGDLATARTRFEEALAEDDSLAPAHIALAAVYLDLGQHEQALASADRGLELRPADREALRVRYEALRGLGRRDEAEAAQAALKEAEGESATAKRIYNEGSEAYQAQDLDQALAKFQEAARMDPSLFDAHHAIATILVHRGEFAEAVDAAERVLQLAPDDPSALRLGYDVYNGVGDAERAAEIAGRLATVDPEFGAVGLLEEGNSRFTAGDVEGARAILEQALAVDPDLAKAHYLLGLCEVNAGNNEAAQRHLSRFLELEPDAPDAEAARQMLSAIE